MKIQIVKVINDANINVLFKFYDRELLLKTRPLDQQISNKKCDKEIQKSHLMQRHIRIFLHVLI